MKKIVLLMMPVIASLTASAQMAAIKLPHPAAKQADRQLIQSMLSAQQHPAPAGKTTLTKKRLVAYSYAVGGDVKDTSLYIYSADRGSSHPHLYSYIDQYIPQNAARPEGGYLHNTQYIQSDTTYRWSAGQTTPLVMTNKRVYEYNAQEKVTTMLDSNTSWYFVKNDYDYDVNGRLSSFLGYDTTGGTALVPKVRTYIIYNGAGQRIMDSTVNLSSNLPVSMTEYAYHAGGDLYTRTLYARVGGNWNYVFQHQFLYDNHRIISFVTKYEYLGDLVDSWKDSFSYSGSNTQFSEYRSYLWDEPAGIWHPFSMEIDRINPQGLVDTYYLYQWNGTSMDTVEKDYIVYDGDGLALYTHGFEYAGNGSYNSLPYDKQTFYYETYTVTGIDAPATGPAIAVYPNPATDHISYSGEAGATLDIRLTSTTGQLLMRQRSDSGNGVISLRSLSPGIYYISFQDLQSGKTYTQRIVRH
ncbi:MAG: T9SS type A sorting domain-containing protein [Sphingobacteriales bacterium]|nr:MAG: T9SS type A sorting domain-containing protein [Sphingobacteriales bacterium]